MTSSLLLAVLLAAPSVPIVKIYVGPQVRDGFVDIDIGIQNSIKDLTRELQQTSGVAVETSESAADIKLYVTRRGIGGPSSTRSVQAAGRGFEVPMRSHFLEALLRVGDYERTFLGEDRDQENWGRCAKLLVKDLSTWLAANRERVLRKP